jgi:hypothetical protein
MTLVAVFFGLLFGSGLGIFGGYHWALNVVRNRIDQERDAKNVAVRAMERAQTQALEATTAFTELKAATLKEALAAGLIEAPRMIDDPYSNKKHICGCNHSKAYHDPPDYEDEVWGSCNQKVPINPGTLGTMVCPCQGYVEVA